jgi:hypothetical protein
MNAALKIIPMPSSFIPPSLQEVEEYFVSIELPRELAKDFIEYYEVGDWLDGKEQPVKNWRLKAVRVWKKNYKARQIGLAPNRQRVVTTSAYHQLVNTEKLLEAKLKMNPGLPTKCLVSQAEWDSAMELQDKWKAEVKELRESIYALRERMRETL